MATVCNLPAGETVKLRSGPSTSGTVYHDQLPNGTAVTLTGEYQNGFTGVKYGQIRGWIMSDYICE